MNDTTKPYDPDNYAPADRLDAYLAAGSPLQAPDGRHLTTRGEVYVPEPEVKRQSKSYDARAFAKRGLGENAWIADGRREYDVKGRELDPAGWPTGKMMDGTQEDSGAPSAPAAPVSLLGGVVWVVLPAPESTVEVPFTTDAIGAYWLEAGEQSDQNWVLSLGGEVIASGNGSSDEAQPFQFKAAGHGLLSLSFNKAAVSDEQLAQRIAAGQGVSKMHYTLHPA